MSNNPGFMEAETSFLPPPQVSPEWLEYHKYNQGPYGVIKNWLPDTRPSGMWYWHRKSWNQLLSITEHSEASEIKTEAVRWPEGEHAIAKAKDVVVRLETSDVQEFSKYFINPFIKAWFSEDDASEDDANDWARALVGEASESAWHRWEEMLAAHSWIESRIGDSYYSHSISSTRIAALLASWFSDANRYDLVVAKLANSGLKKAADRLRYLRDVTDKDIGKSPIRLTSLGNLSLFLMAERQLGTPSIFITPDELAQIEWRTLDGGIVAMEFLTSGWIRFAGISPKIHDGDDRGSVSGVYEKDDALLALRPFLSNIVSE